MTARLTHKASVSTEDLTDLEVIIHSCKLSKPALAPQKVPDFLEAHRGCRLS